MALSGTSICNFGWKARDFALKGVTESPIRLPTCVGRRVRSLSLSAIIVHT